MHRIAEGVSAQSLPTTLRQAGPGATSRPADSLRVSGQRPSAARPRIGVDARDLLIVERTGVERVVFHFIEQLAAFDACEFVLFLDKKPLADLAVCARHEVVVEPRRFGPLRKLFDTWIVFQLPQVLRRYGINAFLSFNTKFPMAAGIPVFATVHGVEWFFCPDGYRMLERVKQRVWFEFACRYCAGIVTFAQSSRRDMLHIRPSCCAPIRVVPEGCDAIFRRLRPDEIAADPPVRYSLRAPYILSVCSLVPRKNIDGLWRAFAQVVHEQAIPRSLALAGKSGWKAERLRALADELGIGKRVRFLGFVPDADLVQLYNQAGLFVYPSKYEGFGLPLLEAMSCGIPVVAANRSATAEVAGDAAVLIDPYSAADLAQGMKRALTDNVLRANLISAGYARAAEYSWARMTEGICGFVLSTAAANPTNRGAWGTG